MDSPNSLRTTAPNTTCEMEAFPGAVLALLVACLIARIECIWGWCLSGLSLYIVGALAVSVLSIALVSYVFDEECTTP